MSKKKRSVSWIVLLVVLGVSGAGFLWARGEGYFGESTSAVLHGEAVKRGPLSITVTESGHLESANSEVYINALEGRTTILYLIEEGKNVQPGDLLCELDTSSLIDRRVSQEISVQSAQAAFTKATQNYEIQKSQNESEIARAERELEFAEEDLQKYQNGDWPMQEQEARESIMLAEEELTRAKTDLEWSEKLAANGFLEQSQLDADRLASTRSEVKQNQAKRALELMKEYEYPRRMKELLADKVEKGRELERARLEAEARIVDFEAEKRSTKAKLDLETSELEDVVKQIERAQIRATVPGMVVYHKERSRFGDSEPIREGTEVRERQELIEIPSSERMIAEVSLHESVLERVEVGLPCRVRVDAIPGSSFDAVVKYRSVLPDQNSFWANPDLRVYRTDIQVLESHPAMRPGMSCSVEILVEDLEDAVYVPVQAVFLDGGDTVAFIAEAGRYERRVVSVGQNDGKVVVVKDGLLEGEVVALSLPPGVVLRPAPDSGRTQEDWELPPELLPPGSLGAQGDGQGGPMGMGGDGSRGMGERGGGDRRGGFPGMGNAERGGDAGGSDGGGRGGDRESRRGGRGGDVRSGGGRPGGGQTADGGANGGGGQTGQGAQGGGRSSGDE